MRVYFAGHPHDKGAEENVRASGVRRRLVTYGFGQKQIQVILDKWHGPPSDPRAQARRSS